MNDENRKEDETSNVERTESREKARKSGVYRAVPSRVFDGEWSEVADKEENDALREPGGGGGKR